MVKESNFGLTVLNHKQALNSVNCWKPLRALLATTKAAMLGVNA